MPGGGTVCDPCAMFITVWKDVAAFLSLSFNKNNAFSFLCVCLVCLHTCVCVCVYSMCMPGANEGQKKLLHILEPELKRPL